jgi:hypothetical protein
MRGPAPLLGDVGRISCETEPLDFDPLEGKTSPDKDVVVITLSDCGKALAGKRDMSFYALGRTDAQKLCVELLRHLAHLGDQGARNCLKRVPKM